MSENELVTILRRQLTDQGYSVETEVRVHKNLMADVIAKKDDEANLIEAKTSIDDAVSVLANVARYKELPGISTVSLALPPSQMGTHVLDIARRIGVGVYVVSQSEVKLELGPTKLPAAQLSIGSSIPVSVAPGKVFEVQLSLAAAYKIVTNAKIGYLPGDPWFVPSGETIPKRVSEIRPGQEERIMVKVGVKQETEPGDYLFFVETKGDGIKSQIQFYNLHIKKESRDTIASEVHSFITIMNGVVNEHLSTVLTRIERAMLEGVMDIHENVVSQSIWAELGNSCLQNGLYRQAQSTYENMLKTIEEWDKAHGENLHKGMALYNLGLALYYQGKISDSRRYLDRAYQEDRRTFGEDEAQGLLAKQALDKLFRS